MTTKSAIVFGFSVLMAVFVLAALVNSIPYPLPVLGAAGESAFTGKAVLVLLQDKTHASTRAGRSLWALERPLTYRVRPGETITVPAGFVTDLASIPRFLSPILPPDGPWAEAAVVHDLCYDTRGSGVWHGHHANSRAAPYTRAECDGILRQAMADIGVGTRQRTVIWLGVRIGGASGFGH